MENTIGTEQHDTRILRVFDSEGKETDFQVSPSSPVQITYLKVLAVFLLASEVWEPLASGKAGYKSDDNVVICGPPSSTYMLIHSIDPSTRRKRRRHLPSYKLASS